jgi:hypothetical protein
MMTEQSGGHMPRGVAKRIANRIARNNEAVVVTSRGGRPGRVYGFEEYRKMVDLPNQVKPWEHRKQKKATPDPLGAVDAAPPTGLSRRELYEEK